MFQNKTEKPDWQLDAELRLNRLESETLVYRKKVDAIYEGEIQPLQQRRIDLEFQIQRIKDQRAKHANNPARIANIDRELESVNAALSEAQKRLNAAEVENHTAMRIRDRARAAWRKVGGGMSIGFDMYKV